MCGGKNPCPVSLPPLPDVVILSFSLGSRYWMSDGRDIHYVRPLVCASQGQAHQKEDSDFFFFLSFLGHPAVWLGKVKMTSPSQYLIYLNHRRLSQSLFL